MTTEIIVVRVKAKLKAALKRAAERQEMSMAEVYRAAFAEYCLARHVEFIAVEEVPVDYSSLLPALAGPGEQGR